MKLLVTAAKNAFVKAAFELQSSRVLEKRCNAEFYPWNLAMILAIQSLQISLFENLFFNHGLDVIDCYVTVGCHNYCRFLIKNWMLLRLRQCRRKPFILVNRTRWTAHALISSCLLHTSGTSPNLRFWLIPSTSLLSSCSNSPNVHEQLIIALLENTWQLKQIISIIFASILPAVFTLVCNKWALSNLSDQDAFC